MLRRVGHLFHKFCNFFMKFLSFDKTPTICIVYNAIKVSGRYLQIKTIISNSLQLLLSQNLEFNQWFQMLVNSWSYMESVLTHSKQIFSVKLTQFNEFYWIADGEIFANVNRLSATHYEKSGRTKCLQNYDKEMDMGKHTFILTINIYS